MSYGRPWTLEDVTTLRALAKEGLSCSQIADRMGRDRITVHQRCLRHSVRLKQNKRWTPLEVAQMHRLIAAGRTTREIADVMPARSWRAIRNKLFKTRKSAT